MKMGQQSNERFAGLLADIQSIVTISANSFMGLEYISCGVLPLPILICNMSLNEIVYSSLCIENSEGPVDRRIPQ